MLTILPIDGRKTVRHGLSKSIAGLNSLLAGVFILAGMFISGNLSAQITQRGSSVTATTTSTTLTINKPTGVQKGDLLIVNITQTDNDGDNLSNATGSGWSLIDGRLIYDAGNDSWWGTILYRVADGTEGTSFSFTLDADANNESSMGTIVAFYNVNVTGGVTATGAAGGPFDLDPGTINVATANQTTATITGLTTASANAGILVFLHSANDVSYSNWTTTSPGALSELADNPFNSTNDLNEGIAGAIKAAAGPTGNATITQSASTRWGGLMVALKPCVAPTITGTLNVCVGGTTQLNGSGTPAASSPWTSASTGVATVSNTGLVTGVSAGTSVITYTNNLGCLNTATVTVVGAPTANAGTAVNTCSNSSPVNITAGSSASNNAAVSWSSSGTGTFANATSLTTATYTPSPADITAGSVTLTLTATPNSPCAANATSNKTLTINQAPGAVAGTAVITCSTTGAVNITAGSSATNNASITWSTSNGTGSFANANSLTTATYTPSSADITAGSRTLVLTAVGNPGCANATNNKSITITAAPTAAAGNAVNTCSNSAPVNITSGATSSNNSGITWSSSGTGTFANANSLTTATYTPSPADITAGSVTITLTATPNSPCASNAVSNKTLTINTLPTAVAGTAVLTCSNSGAVNITAGSSATNQASITWSTSNGTGSFASANSLTAATYSPSAADNTAGTRTLVLTAFGKTGCSNVTDTKLINITTAPGASAGTAIITCANSGAVNITTGSTASNNAGITWTSSGTGTFADANSLTTATYDPSPADILAGSVTLTLTATGNSPCANATSNKTLTIRPIPASAGVAVCQGTASQPLTSSTVCPSGSPITAGPNFAGAATTSGSGTAWSSPGNIFSNNSANATVSMSGIGTATSQSLNATGFGFNIPANATITAITVNIERNRSGNSIGEIKDNSVRLLKAGVATGDNDAAGTNWPTSATVASYGGVTNALWNTTWTPAQINASNFGVALVVDFVNSFTRTANVDYIEISINYTLPGSLNWYTVSSGGTSIGSGSSFDPVGVLNSGLANTNTPGITTYYVECTTVAGCRTPTDYVINAAPAAPISGGDQLVCEDGNPAQTLTATATGGTITWYNAATNGSVVTPTQVGVGSNTYYAQAFDGTCSSLSRTAVNLTITAAPVAVASNQTVCSDGTPTQTLTATATGGTITWYDAAVAGNVVADPSQTGVGTVTYYAEAFDGSCTSLSRTAVTLTINPVPDAPVSGGNQSVCQDGNPSQTLTATATGGTITWYDAATNGNVVTPTQVGVGTSTYYAEASDGTCSSPSRTAVTLTIIAAPAAPSASNQTVCEDGNPSQTLTATATEGTITWYDAAVGGNIVADPSQTGAGTSTYYAESFDGTCTSLTRTAVTLTIIAAPAAPSASNQTVCEDGNPSQTLTATATGGTITWYDAAVAGNIVADPSQTGVGTSTYYAESFDGACTSLTRTAVTLTINAAPAAPVGGGDQTVCEDGNPSQTLTATATGGTITWYDAAAGGNIVADPSQTGVGTSTYYAEAFDGTCSSLTRTAVTLTITAAPIAVSGNQTVCEDGNPLQTLTATATGGTITWYDAAVGGNIVADPSQTGVGTSTYYAEASDGTCISLTRAISVLTITAAPSAPVSGGDQTVCEDGNPLQSLTATAIGGTITWYDTAIAGNVVADPSQTGVGTSTYYAESSDGTCSSLARTAVTLTINAAPSAPSASNQSVCSDGSPAQTLTAVATGGTITWYDAAVGGNTVANPTQVGIGTSTYYAESFDGTCSSLSRTAVTLTINNVPGAPTSGGNQEVCSDGSPTQTLTATATGGTITWYDATVGGNVVADPSQIGVGTSTFYAESSDGTCSSLSRTAVTLTINPLPATATLDVVQPNCISSTGSITVTAPVGAGLQYNIGNGFQSSPVFNNLSANTYNISVQNAFGCVSLLPASATINPQPFVPGAPVVTGIVNVCPYINTNEQVSYTANVPGATSYNWILPPNTVLQSGGGTNTIFVTFNTGFDQQPNKQIRVTAVSECGVSAQTIYYLEAKFPSTPGAISGPVDICSIIGTENTATYTIAKIAAATSYAWTTQAGTTSVIHPNGPGVNDTTIIVTFGAGFTSSPITVTAANGCGTSGAVRSLFIPRNGAPTPGLISGPNNVCANILPSGVAAVYSVSPVAGATSYTWSAPANSVVTHPNGLGANDYTITVQFPAGFTSGTISVSATNGCGTSSVRSFSVTKLNPATPSMIDVIQTQVCPERIYTYTLSSVPANSTSVVWTIPTAQGAVLLNQTATGITVSYPPTPVVGTISVQSFNNCASSSIRTVNVKIGACAPEERSNRDQQVIAGKSKPVAATTETMSVKMFPNPTVSDFKLQVATIGKETIYVKILDMQGRVLKNITVMPYQSINLGSDLKAGSYIVEVTQGKNKTTQKLQKF